ncbi:endopeptidase [Leuconostoc phage LLC-1]|nr:endopeptidase [Leuconostoc phage LLC-1]
MIYIFDKTQAIIKVLTNDDFTAAHLNFKINTATTFEFSLPASKALPSGSKYVATPHPLNDSKFIMLRLTERVDNTETIDYSAYELAYQELATDGYIEDKRPHNQSALNLMKIALDGSNWELNNVNVSGTATTNFYYVDRLSAISKVVDLLGGEIVFYIEIQGNAISGRYMDYLARQGADTSKVFASGSNLLTVERQSDTSNIYTAILPRGKGKEIDNGDADTPDGYGRRINIADVEWKKSAGKPLDKPKGSIILSDPDATAEWGQINGNARLLPQTYDDIDDVNVLINSAYKTLQSVNHPQIQYSATVADVGGLSLGDTVLIMHGDRDLSYKTRVFEVKYDLLSPDQTELSLGDDLSSNSITSQINSLNAVADTISSQTQWTINQIGRPGTTFGNTEPANPKVGDVFFKELPDGGTEIHRWNGNIWELLASPTTADDIAKAVNDAVSQAKSHTDEVKQGLSSDIATAKSQAASLASTAQQNAIDVASKSLGTYLVRLLPGTNIFKTTNSTTIQAQVWKAGQDITSTLDNASFSWKIAKDGAAAISLTNNVKNVTAKPSDFNSTGTYIVNVIIPVTDTTGTTRNQTFSDSTTIAKVADGVNGANGNGISKTTITYQLGTSATTAPTGTWTSTVPTLVKGQYLWTRTVWSYTDRTTETGYSVAYVAKDGNNGTDGVAGKDGVGITSTIITYAGSTSGTVAPTTGYTSAVPTVTAGNFLWTKTVWNYSDNTTETGYSVAKMGEKGADGKDGIPGKDGNGIASTSITYATSTSGITAPAIGYTSTIPSVAKGSYLWQRTIYTFTNGTTKTSDIVTYFAKDGLKGADGMDGGQGMIAQPTKPTTGLVDGFLWLDTSQNYPIYYIYDSSIKEFKIYQFNAKNINADQIKAKFVGTDRLSASEIIADDLHVKSANIDGKMTASQITVSSTNGSQTSLANFNLGEMSQTISDTKNAVNNLGQVNQLMNTEFTPDFAGWYDRGFHGKGIKVSLGTPRNGSNVIAKIDGSPIRLQSEPIAVTPGMKVSYWVNKLTTTGLWSYLNASDKDGNIINVPNTTSNEIAGSSKAWIGAGRVENITIPDGVAYISLGFLVYSAIPNGDVFQQPMLVFSDHVGAYVQGNYNNNAALAQVKITAEGISNFVRDSSGNLSSDFQTALSKTSIITGSTLATSIQKQTATQITSALTDNNGKIISLINQDSSGVQIAGKNIVLDGNTTVTGDFYAKGGNFKNLNASNLTVGTLNGTQVNITNINANNIVSGAISGANLNINLNTGSVVFQKGRINSSDYTTDINIDKGYISTANSDTRAILKNGQLQLTSPNYYDLQTNPYLSIYNDQRAFDSTGKFNSAVISARDRVIIGNKDGINDMLWFGDTFYFGKSNFYGLSSGTNTGKATPTTVGGGKTGVVLVGGSTYTNVIGGNDSPSIIVGWSPDNIYSGNRIRIEADYFHVGAVYNRTTSSSSNVFVAADGALVRSSSARKYKLDIKNNIPISDSLKLIDVPLSTWVDKREHEENGSNERYFGMIAEDLRDAGLEYLVQYGEDNEVEGINYDRVALLLIPLVKELKERIEKLESKGK